MLSIVLDLEHYAKVEMLNVVEKTSKDGYELVKEYINDFKKRI